MAASPAGARTASGPLTASHVPLSQHPVHRGPQLPLPFRGTGPNSEGLRGVPPASPLPPKPHILIALVQGQGVLGPQGSNEAKAKEQKQGLHLGGLLSQLRQVTLQV